MVGHGPEMKNAMERLGEIGFSVVRCLWRFPETTFIQPHWVASLGSKKKVDFASGAHGFPFKFFLASYTSSDASCLPFSTVAVTVLAVSSPRFCLLSSAPSGWLSSVGSLLCPLLTGDLLQVSANFPLPSLRLVLSSLEHQVLLTNSFFIEMVPLLTVTLNPSSNFLLLS